MGDKKKISIELPPAAFGRFAEAAQLMRTGGVPDVTPEELIGILVRLANPALVVRRTLAHFDPACLTVDEEYDLEMGLFGK